MAESNYHQHTYSFNWYVLAVYQHAHPHDGEHPHPVFDAVEKFVGLPVPSEWHLVPASLRPERPS